MAATGRSGRFPRKRVRADTARIRFGFGDGCVVLVAADETGNGLLGTITLEPFGPHSELARDATEADARAFAVSPSGQGQGIGGSCCSP